MMKPCYKCGAAFEPSKSQLKSRSYLCSPCSSARVADYKRRRKEHGVTDTNPKPCSKCGTVFMPSPSARVTSQYVCMECEKVKNQKYRAEHKEQARRVTRVYRNRRKADPILSEVDRRREHERELRRRLEPDINAKRAMWHRNQLQRDPGMQVRIEARRMVHLAINKGDIIPKPCEVCGLKAEAHHPDYSKPLEVQWLCRSHHRALHIKSREASV